MLGQQFKTFSTVKSRLTRIKATKKVGLAACGNGLEVAQKPSLNPNPVERRFTLYAYLGHCIRVSHEKMSSKGNSDAAKQSWGRLMVSAITAYGGLIKDAQLEDIESRLTKLEEQAKERPTKR